MKMLVYTLMSALLMSVLLTGCEDEEVAEEESTSETDEAQAPGADGEIIADEEEASAGDEDELALEGQQWLQSELYDIQLAIPDNWLITPSDEVVTAHDPDGSTTVIIAGSESERSVQEAINNLKSELEFTDVEIETSDPTQLGGFPGHGGSGSAVLIKEDDIDTEIQFIGYAIRVGENNVTLMIFSEATMYEAKKDIIDGIAATLTRI